MFTYHHLFVSNRFNSARLEQETANSSLAAANKLIEFLQSESHRLEGRIVNIKHRATNNTAKVQHMITELQQSISMTAGIANNASAVVNKFTETTIIQNRSKLGRFFFNI